LKSISTLLKTIIHDNYNEMILSAQNAEKLYSGAEDIKALLRASVTVLRALIMRKITRDFINLPLKDVSKYLALR